VLTYLKIENVAIIDQLEVEFSSGLNILSGETGAGKSIIIDSLGQLLGDKSSAELVRSGEQNGSVEGIFDISENEFVINKLSELNIESDNKEIIIRRNISSSGRSQAYINNNLVTIKDLKTIGQKLVDIHGQHEHQELLYNQNHLDLLDNFAYNGVIGKEVKESYQHIKNILSQLEAAKMDERDKSQKIDLLSFQINEIEQARLKIGEDKELEDEKRLLANAEKLHQLSTEALQYIQSDENAILQQLTQLLKALKGLSEIDQKFQPYEQQLEEKKYQLEDLTVFLQDYKASIAFEPERLAQIEDRILEINRLKRKYGDSIREILAHRDKAQQELDMISLDEEREKKLTEALQKELELYIERATQLSNKRKADANNLEKRMKQELNDLAMEKAHFAVRFSPQPVLNNKTNREEIKHFIGEKGIDRLEFFISPNVGEELKPLAKIASGGELSRLMLALKSAASAKEIFKTLIFDEVDIGIGGRVAEVIGRKLRTLSENQQIICITHLPQIAAYAEHHYLVEKKVIKNRTQTILAKLKPEQRIEEIARMLGGVTITETTRQHARELLQQGASTL
jgi:DNA repair protein RecN (Recombination protein N)